MVQKKPIIKYLLFPTYLTMIKKSVGSPLFKTAIALVNGQEKNILKNGRVACAFYVSSILLMFKLIKDQHATVKSTVEDLEKSGWQKINRPKIGCIIVWAKDNFGDGLHEHIGFYIGKQTAISNSSKKQSPTRHHWTYTGKRKVQLLLWHKKLDNPST